jgi:hypothetical protein
MPIFRVDDVAAMVLLSMTLWRRLNVLRTEREAFPQATDAAFQHWRTEALKGYNLGALGCLLKVVGSQAWFWSVAPDRLLLTIGGFSMFVLWIIAIVVAWRRTTEARALRAELGPELIRKR